MHDRKRHDGHDKKPMPNTLTLISCSSYRENSLHLEKKVLR